MPISYIFSKGFSVVDVRDPARPKRSATCPRREHWSLHLQTHEDLLLVVNQGHVAQPELADEKNYSKASQFPAHAAPSRAWTAGLRSTISKARTLGRIGFIRSRGGCIACGMSADVGPSSAC